MMEHFEGDSRLQFFVALLGEKSRNGHEIPFDPRSVRATHLSCGMHERVENFQPIQLIYDSPHEYCCFAFYFRANKAQQKEHTQDDDKTMVLF
jgi:hypothetical protein